MIYHAPLGNGENIAFVVYDYHYQDREVKRKLESTYPNIVVLLKKTDNTYTHLETLLLNSPHDYFVTSLPTDTLYQTDKVLLLIGNRPPGKYNTIKYLQDLIVPLQECLQMPVPAHLLEKGIDS